jgi:hypothetical protein
MFHFKFVLIGFVHKVAACFFEREFTTLAAVRADVVRLGRCSNVAFLLSLANERQP